MRPPRLLTGIMSIGFTGSLLAIGCSDQTTTSNQASTLPGVESGSSLLKVHAPGHAHGGAIVLQVPDPSDSYTGLDAASAAETGGSLHLTIDASGPIPRFADEFISSVPVFGYAWADLDTGTGIVLVIHPAIGRDSQQRPDSWHTHNVELGAGTGDSDFCIVEIGRRQTGMSFQDDLVRLASPLGGISADALDVAASFTVQAEAACGSGLGVVLIDTAAL